MLEIICVTWFLEFPWADQELFQFVSQMLYLCFLHDNSTYDLKTLRRLYSVRVSVQQIYEDSDDP